MSNLVKEVQKVNDLDELKQIQDAAKSRLERLSAANINVGDKVQLHQEYQGRKPYDTIGTVEKVNPKRFKVTFGTYGGYTVPHSMVKKVD